MAPREQAHLRSHQAPGQPKTDDQAIARREDPPPADLWDSPAASCPTPKRLQLWSQGTWQAPSALMPSGAGPVLSLAGQGACALRRDDSAVTHPGGRLSGWLAGLTSRHACWRVRVPLACMAQACQALIRESLGLLKSVPT